MSASVSKAELVNEVAEATGLKQQEVKTIVEGMLGSITTHLKQGNKVQLTGFGQFEVRERQARTGVKPGTKERVEIPAGKRPAFKAGKSLKDQLSG